MDYLEIVQGDSFEGQWELIGDDATNVKAMTFYCEALGLTYELHETLDPTVWTIQIPSDDTTNLRLGVFGYNVVAELLSGRIITVIYDAKIKIVQKVNKWTEAN